MATAARTTNHAGAALFQKARRENVPLKIALFGPSGSGKTDGALALARGLVGPTGRIAVVDSENGSASLYAQEHDFDTLCLEPPYTTDKYLEAIEGAVAAGYDVVILDTISHQWSGTGGILERVDKAKQRPGVNQWTVWAPFTEEHERFRAAMLQSPIHLIATMRAKQGYVLEENARGKQTPKKVGMEPIQREGLEYEFSLVFELQMDHRGAVSKDRTKMFSRQGELVDLKDAATAARLTDWLQAGAVLADDAAPSAREQAKREAAARREGTLHVEPGGQAAEQSAAQQGEKPAPAKMTLNRARTLAFPFWKGQPQHGKPLVEITTEDLQRAQAQILALGESRVTPRVQEALQAIRLVLESRAKRDAAPAAAGSGSAGTLATPAPGRVEDALTPTVAAAPEEQPLPVRLADHLLKQLASPDMPKVVGDEIRGAFDRGEIQTEAQLRDAIRRAADALLPF